MLNVDALASRFADIVADSTGYVADLLAEAYNDYAKEATILGADCSLGGNVDLLVSAFSVNNSIHSIEALAQGICLFWQSVPKIGIPSHGGIAVISVVPSFASQVSAMTALISGLVTDQPVENAFKRLFHAIELLLKTAPVLVTETMPTTPPSPSTFPETLK